VALGRPIEEVVPALDARLVAAGSAERAARERAYLKSDLNHYGAPVPAIRAAVRDFFRSEPDLDHDDLVGVVGALWQGRCFDRRAAAIELCDVGRGHLVAGDLAWIESLLRESRTWALVDHLAEKVVGELVVRFPEVVVHLDKWSTDEDFWIRRSSLLALLGPLRAGAGDFDRFARYADGMLEEPEFFIRKAIGWVLRETGKRRPELSFAWLLPRAARCSGVTLREALKPLTLSQRAAILDAR
jgi:3-methyladenine DNA glycosylase AlkD